MQTVIKNKMIILGVSGGIAAYKSVELLRLLTGAGAAVRVVMTRNAQWFVGPLTFKTLSGQPVCTDLFDGGGDASIRHIDWAREADAVVIAPATANIIAKLANGIADDALSTLMLAVTAPVFVCPSMNTHMYESRPVQTNLERLTGMGYTIMEPSSGQLACGTTGPGRLPDPELILDRLISGLTPKDFQGKRVLVTAGPTHEAMDPVRFISNPSSGKMGYAVARAAEQRGAEVTLVSGPSHLPDPPGIATVRVRSAAQMAAAVFERSDRMDIVVKAAAVSDYRPLETAASKIKKDKEELQLTLKKNQDILGALGKRKKKQVLIGFAAETEDLKKNAAKKLKEKNCDIIVGNLVGKPDSGFASDTNQVTLFFKDGSAEALDVMEKESVAGILLDRIKERFF
ncbi:MAG: bifunctional phosphopantothenoylcysteine decarboxylase/phosphopantothenate--cysteine ligase CoaBC [Thermodesulfobacteriota bacterium]